MAARSSQECSACEFLQRDIDNMKINQSNRPCAENTRRIQHLEESDGEQWTAINELRRTVWSWRGGLALAGFVGSIVGSLIIRVFVK